MVIQDPALETFIKGGSPPRCIYFPVLSRGCLSIRLLYCFTIECSTSFFIIHKQ